MAELLKLGSLWRGTDKSGNEMLSGTLSVPVDVTINGDSRIVILTNDRKEAENHPDFQMFVGKVEPRE